MYKLTVDGAWYVALDSALLVLDGELMEPRAALGILVTGF